MKIRDKIFIKHKDRSIFKILRLGMRFLLSQYLTIIKHKDRQIIQILRLRIRFLFS